MDWYEATVELDGERITVHVFSMRSMASGGAFHMAYRHATQQAFLEAHEPAFPWRSCFHFEAIHNHHRGLHVDLKTCVVEPHRDFDVQRVAFEQSSGRNVVVEGRPSGRTASSRLARM